MQLADEADEDDPFAKEGEVGNSYKERDGWFDEQYVYLRTEALAKIMDGFGKARLYGWLHTRGALHKGNPKADRWTVYVPRLTPRRTALRIDMARLQELIGEGDD